MDSFNEARKVEAESWRRIEPIVRSWFTDFFLFDNGELSKDFQVICDAVGRSERTGKMLGVEFKAERRYTGNFFLELHSNLAPKRYSIGWFYKSRADILVYHFLDEDLLFAIDLPALQKWAFEMPDGRVPRIMDYKALVQQVHEQKNKTCGSLVPIHMVRDAIGFYLEIKVSNFRVAG